MKTTIKTIACLTAVALMGITAAQVSAQQDTVVGGANAATPLATDSSTASAADEADANLPAESDKTITNTVLHAYPNPMFSDQLTITNERLRKGDKIEIYSITGTRLKTYAAAGKTTTLNLSQLPSGVYIVKATNAMAKVMKW
jgi:hypothetical protein